jgi:hypothetical protein
MRRSIVLVLTGTVVVAAALVQSGALAAPPRQPATIRVEGAKRTLVLPKDVQPRSGSITKYGAPKGKCPRRSVQGALDVATHGHWKGTWYSQYNEYLVTSILGEKPAGHNFWELFVNDQAASKGACDVQLRSGERILFADTDGKHYPARLKAPGCIAPRSKFKVKVAGYAASGKSTPLAGVKISSNRNQSATTNRNGVASLRAGSRGRLVLRASPRGYIRTEAVIPVVSQACGAY